MYALGGELVARTLAAQGVSTIYTLCGGHVMGIYDGCLNNNIAIIDFRHEQAAAHAADAHARLTHNIGVAVVTAGPGVTDAVTAVANAYEARSPLVLIGGAAPLKTKGRGALQDMPQLGLFQDITKAAFTITETERIPQQLHEAFRVALSGRPGPVFIEIPFDVLFNAVEPPEIPPRVHIEPQQPELTAVARMFEILRTTASPIIIAGTQVYWDQAAPALRDLTEQTAIPVFTNGAGRGTLPMNHPNCFKSARSAALRQADVVILLGTPLDFRLKYGQEGWNPAARLIQIENDPAELNRNRQADVALAADSRLVLEALSEGLQGIRFDDWLAQIRAIESKKNAEQQQWEDLDDSPINHFRFAAEVSRFIDSDTIVIGDGGDIVTAVARVLQITQPGQWLDPGPLGCLGVGAPFAIAAKHLFPHKKVLIINGDGAFGLNGFEFDTALRFNLPIVSIVGNDAGWGNIRLIQQQMIGADRAVATSLNPTRYDRIVQAMGGYGEHITDPADIQPALQRAFASGLPACLNVTIDPQGLAKTAPNMAYIV